MALFKKLVNRLQEGLQPRREYLNNSQKQVVSIFSTIVNLSKGLKLRVYCLISEERGALLVPQDFKISVRRGRQLWSGLSWFP